MCNVYLFLYLFIAYLFFLIRLINTAYYSWRTVLLFNNYCAALQAQRFCTIMLHYNYTLGIIGASLSEPHIDELHVRNLYIYVLYMVRPSPARRYIQCTATRDIFRRPHEQTSALSGTACIIIAESAKQIHKGFSHHGVLLKMISLRPLLNQLKS